jgi:hypothetical protein
MGLTGVEYSARRLCSDEREKFKVRINPNSLNSLRENVTYLLMKVGLSKLSHIPDAVHAYDRRSIEFVIKTLPVCFSTKGDGSGFVDARFHVV